MSTGKPTWKMLDDLMLKDIYWIKFDEFEIIWTEKDPQESRQISIMLLR